MTPTFRLAGVLWLCLTALVVARGGATAGTERRYTLSADPEHEILSVEWTGVPHHTHRFSLYGDGRLVGSARGPRADNPVDEVPVELRLSPLEARVVVDIVVQAGLMEFLPSDTWKRLRPGAQGEPPGDALDAAGLALRVSLMSYDTPGRKEGGSLVHATSMSDPETMIRAYRKAKQQGRIAASEPDTFVEAEALLALYDYLESLVYGNQGP